MRRARAAVQKHQGRGIARAQITLDAIPRLAGIPMNHAFDHEPNLPAAGSCGQTVQPNNPSSDSETPTLGG